jgi:carbamoyl-phosphate synthase large subunit
VAAFEPSIDYVVVKIPRWAFEKFPGVDRELGPQMKSVGEAMAIGRTFKEALQKAVRSLEIGRDGLGVLERDTQHHGYKGYDAGVTLHDLLRIPNRDRLFAVHEALLRGTHQATIAQITGYDPWFVAQIGEIAAFEQKLTTLDRATLRKAKRMGFSDRQLARVVNERVGSGEWREGEVLASPISTPQSPNLRISELDIRRLRADLGLIPTYHQVDTCAAEFEAYTPYLYSSYESESEAAPTDRRKIIILGGGPNRIGQGIEFDYCCCHAAFALHDLGYETVMVNCNPETVSTDYDTSDRLYFEPLTLEDVLNIVEREGELGELGDWGKEAVADAPISQSPLHGVIVQFGGQTPLNLAGALQAAGVPILGTTPDAIDLAEDRDRFGALLDELDISAPDHGSARTVEEAIAVAAQIGYPVVVRPSYVLGGRAMAIVDGETDLCRYMAEAVSVVEGKSVLIDKFLEDAFEVDVDALCDGERVVIGGIMQHIEEAGIHSGDSACVLPPYKISNYHLSIIREYTEKLGLALQVRGLMNVQYAIKDDVVYVLEVNPRASRTVPFVSKATGIPLAKIAARVMAGESLAEIGISIRAGIGWLLCQRGGVAVEEVHRHRRAARPEMRSTGEVMGHASSFGHAFAKSQLGAGAGLPLEGGVLVTVNDYDKGSALKLARDLHRMGFTLYATAGTGAFFERAGMPVTILEKGSSDLSGYSTLDAMRDDKVQLIINTPLGPNAREDGAKIRRLATRMEIPLITTLSAARPRSTASAPCARKSCACVPCRSTTR